MNRVRWNYKLIVFITGLCVLLLGALFWRTLRDGTAEVRETQALTDAAAFLKTNAVATDEAGSYFLPLSQPLQQEFSDKFRDRNGTPFFYDPWQADGTPVRCDPQNEGGIVAYTLTASGRERTILTAALAIRVVPDAEIDWPIRRWRQ